MKSIDVVVPCYRYGNFLKECVQSVLNQDVPAIRVLILDDASPDNTAEVGRELAERDPRVTFRRHEVNKGHIATYNEGIDWVTADYMLLLSADDYLLPGALGRSLHLMEEFQDVAFTFGNVIELGVTETKWEATRIAGVSGDNSTAVLPGEVFIELSGSRNIVPTPTAIVRMKHQHKVGGYRKELPHTGDLEMWLRLAATGPVGVIGAYQAVYRKHANNMSTAYYRQNRLPDLIERRAALQVFLREYGTSLKERARVVDSLFRSLSLEAIGNASAAFNEGELELADEIANFAVDIFPAVRRSMPWLRLSFKRLLGIKGWRALQPAFSRLRRFASPTAR